MNTQGALQATRLQSLLTTSTLGVEGATAFCTAHAQQLAEMFALARPADAALLQDMVELKLGGVIYEVKPSPIIKTRPWRERVLAMMQSMVSLADLNFEGKDKEKNLLAALTQLLVEMPEEVLRLLVAYSPVLEKAKKLIMEDTTEVELAHAVRVLAPVAFPFVRMLREGMTLKGLMATSEPTKSI
jgi:hypothetical protein